MQDGKIFLQRVDDKSGRVLDAVSFTRIHLRFEVLDRIADQVSAEALD